MSARIHGEQNNESPNTGKYVLIFLIVFLIAILVIPSEWLLKWSFWWNNIQ